VHVLVGVVVELKVLLFIYSLVCMFINGVASILRLVLKEEASDFLELETIKNLVTKYSQFINFPIYVWTSKVII